MRSALKGLFCLVAALAACLPLEASDAFIVTDPKDLQLVDLSESFKYVSDQFEQRRDLLSTVRRAAGRKIAKGWGLDETPDKSKLALGIVADRSSGTLEFAAVMTGDSFDSSRMRAKILEKYGEHYRRHQKTLAPTEATIAGEFAIVLPHLDGKGEYVLVPMGHTLVLGSTLPGHHDVIDRTLQVVREPSLRHGEPPASVRLTDTGSLTPEERKSAKDSTNRTITGKVEKFRGEFAKLYHSLDSQEFDPNEFKSRSEKITDLYLKHADWSVELQYARGAGPGTDSFHLSYQLRLNSPAEAQELKELLLEKLLFYKENASAKAGMLAVDSIALDVQGPSVVIRANADSPSATYNLVYAYVAYLLGSSQVDSFLGID